MDEDPWDGIDNDGDGLIDLRSGQKLFASFPSADKRWIEVDGGTHSNVLTTPMPLYSMMADWILEHINADTATPIPIAHPL